MTAPADLIARHLAHELCDQPCKEMTERGGCLCKITANALAAAEREREFRSIENMDKVLGHITKRALSAEKRAESAEAALKEAVELLEVCRVCDLIYDYKDATGTRAYNDSASGHTVAEKVDAFLAKHGAQK